MHSDAEYIFPYKGKFRVRIKVPDECRGRLPEPHTNKIELLKTLDTVNKTHAKILGRPIVNDYLLMIEAARPAPSPWLQAIWRELPGIQVPGYGYLQGLEITGLPPLPQSVVFSQHPDSLPLALALKAQEARQMVDVTPALPTVEGLVGIEEKVTFDLILDTWGKESGHQHVRDEAGNIVTRDTARDNFQTVFDHLQRFLGHDNAAIVTDKDMNRWLDHLLDTKGHETVKKYVTVARRVFKVAKKRQKITVNPCTEDFTFTPTKAPNRSRNEGFTALQLVTMLEEARKAVKPVIRIAILIHAYHGPRLSEIVEASTKDFVVDGDDLIFHIRLDNRPETQRVKTNYSLRRFPLHRAIVAEVKAYLASIPEGPLFPQIKLDRYGKIGHNAGEHLRKWLRLVVPEMPKGDATHVFRHTIKTAMRGRIDKEIRNYLTGHKEDGQAAEYGKYAISTLREELVKLPTDPMAWNLE